uniref:WD repeat domain phosphoinositide-interacting protein 2-like n=1 Tax=Styela clava TaxID=7725 RepID=UPI0019393FFC|nr:WD repeat domain phosphoinositide-interacting protein 2-like [Styela clava]
MNSAHVTEAVPQDGSNPILFINFNQDFTSLSIGSKYGYKLYTVNSVDNLEKIYDNASETTDVCIVERLFSSSLVAIVSTNAPRKLKVCHFKKGTEICNYSYSNTILAVKLNRLRLVVVLEESLYIHNIKDMKVLHTIRDTPPNRDGICALSVNNNDVSFLAYPGSTLVGEVQIFDITNLKAVMTIPAHDSPLAALTFDSSGTKLATASERGTVIRVFSIPDGQRLFELRRGMKRCVRISSLAFSTDSVFLCASSNTETVHIYKLIDPGQEKNAVAATEDGSTWMGYFNKVLTTSANYLPTQVSSVLNQGRDFATVKLPVSGTRNVCAIVSMQKLLRVVVAGYNGYLYIYSLDAQEGGDCSLIRQHSVLQNQSDDMEQGATATPEPDQAGESPDSNKYQHLPTTSIQIEASASHNIVDDKLS